MRADPNDSKVTRTMMGLGVPEEVARAKTRAWKGGIVVAIFGGLVSLGSFAFPLLAFVVLKETPSVALLLFSGVAFLIGMLMVFIGAHAASGEAMAAAGKDGSMLFGAIAAAARKVRGGT